MKQHLIKVAISAVLLAKATYSTAITQPDLEALQLKLDAEEYRSVVQTIENSGIDSLGHKYHTLYIYAQLNLDLDDAEDAANKALKLFPNNADLYLMHAGVMGAQAQDSVFSALGYAEKALNSLKTAVEIEPNIPKYRLGLMGFYLGAPSIAGGDDALALVQANKIKELDELKGAVALSRYYAATDDTTKAIEVVKAALQISPNNPMLYNQLASVHLLSDEHENAIIAYQKIVGIGLPEKIIETEDAKANELATSEYETSVYRYYNSYYQIGRLALLGETMTDDGILHLTNYLSLYKTTEADWQDLPTDQWAKLRLSALYLQSKQPAKAIELFSSVQVDKDDKDMKSTHKKLAKKIKKAKKKLT